MQKLMCQDFDRILRCLRDICFHAYHAKLNSTQ